MFAGFTPPSTYDKLAPAQTPADQGLHAVPGTLGAEAVVARDRGVVSQHLGQGLPSVEYVVQWGIEHRQLGPIAAIGVDEIQYARGHKYLTLVYQIEQQCTRLLWSGRWRASSSSSP